MPKDRYRLYHLERAKAGVAMVMTAGSASVSRDSPPVFSNLLVWKDEIVPWMKRLTDDCHGTRAQRGGICTPGMADGDPGVRRDDEPN